MDKRKILIIISIISIIFLALVFSFERTSVTKTNAEKNTTNSTTITGNYGTEYSRAYQEWLQLSDEEKSKLGVIPRKYDVPLDSIYEDTITVKEKPNLFNLFGLFSKEVVVSEYAESIPETYDLREKIDIASKDQKTYGVCWAFSSFRSLETNLLLNRGESYDFSELHVDYLTSKQLDSGANRYLHQAGSFQNFEDYAFNNDGPVLEEDVPYDEVYTSDEYEDLKSLKNEAYLIDTVNFPTIDKISKNYTEEELTLFRDKVKKHIIENGSIYVIINSTEIKYSDEGEAYTLYNKDFDVDHAVSIIGWNDAFPKEYFSETDGSTPEEDGAYIAINSWGTDTEIIYISYEDVTVEYDMNGVVAATTEVEEVKDTTTFKDKNLYNYIVSLLGDNIISKDDETLTINYLDNIKPEIVLTGENITDLTGLEKLNVCSFEFQNGGITDINILANWPDLQYLDLEGNLIENIDVLSNLTELNSIFLTQNKISTIPDLSGLVKLYNLYLDENEISDINNLQSLKEIRVLWLRGNEISDISVLSNLTKLMYLSLSDNKISDISVLEDLNDLKEVYIMENKIEREYFISDKNALEIIEIPQIIKAAQDESDLVYSAYGFTLTGCTWNDDNSAIIIDPSQNRNARVEINSGNAIATTFTVTLQEIELSAIEVNIEKANTTYIEGQELDRTGLVIKAIYNNGDIENIDATNSEVTISGYDKTKVGVQTITVTYKGMTATFEVTVEKEITGLEGFEIVEEDGIKYIINIQQGTEVKDMSVNTNIEIHKESTKVTDEDMLIETGMILKLKNQEYVLVVRGDVTGDGDVNLNDAIQILRHCAGGIYQKLTGAHLKAAQIIKQGQVNTNDAIRILKYIATKGASNFE